MHITPGIPGDSCLRAVLSGPNRTTRGRHRDIVAAMQWCISVATVIVVTAPVVIAAEPQKPADLYKQAFAGLATLSRDESRQFLGDRPPPMDDATVQFLKKYEPAMALIERAAKIKEAADWKDHQLQLHAFVTQYSSPARYAVQVADLQARFDLSKGDGAKAADRLFAVVAMARQLAHQKPLFGRTSAADFEIDAIDRLARLLASLPPEAVKSVAARWPSLPPLPSGKETMLAEAEFIKAAPDPKVTPEQRSAIVAFATNLADAFDQPAGAFTERVRAEAAKFPGNQLVAQSAQLLPTVREKVAAAAAKHAMLPVAANVKLNGEGAVAASNDPFGQGPFKLEKLAGGFRLVSAETLRGRPVTLVVSTNPND